MKGFNHLYKVKYHEFKNNMRIRTIRENNSLSRNVFNIILIAIKTMTIIVNIFLTCFNLK